MKPTRFLSLLLAVLTIVSTVFLSSCGDGEGTGESTSTREIIALNMYILTNEDTDAEAAKAVQMELNRYLLPNHKTLLKINYLTVDEYWDVVNEMLEKTDPMNSTSASVISTNATVVGTEGMSFTQMVEFIFDKNTTDIELSQDQIDIFVVNDFEIYNELANDGKLKGLGSYLSYDSKILSTTIHPTFMSAAKLGTETYGIPTNKGVEAGEYTYLVFNENLLEQHGYEVADLRVFSSNDLATYLQLVKDNNPGIWPLSEPFGVAGAEYYDDAFIVKNLEFNRIGSDCKPTFMFNDYNSNKAVEERYESLGFFPKEGEAGPDAKYAIRVETSTELLCAPEDKRWTDEDGTTYVRFLFDIPRVDIDEAFSSVMCVSATSPVPDRAMEIITLFHTDATAANLLQYGIEGVNYQVNRLDGSITILEDSNYSMDNLITGNTFIKYPENNDKKYLEKAIRSNLTAAPSAFLGFNPIFDGTDLSQYEITRTIVLSGTEAFEGDLDYETARKIVNRELNLLGYATVAEGTSELAGIYGKVQKAQQQLAAPIEKQLALSEDILNYNAPYGLILEKNEFFMDVPADEAADGEENADGEVVDGEAVDGEATAETEETVVEGEAEATEVTEATEAEAVEA